MTDKGMKIIVPEEEEEKEKHLAPRLKDLKGKVMGILDISKPKGDIYLQRIEELLKERYNIKDTIRMTKPTFTRPAPDEIKNKMATSCDFIIIGLAD